MKEQLNQILNELEEIISERNYKLNDFEKLDISVRILNTNQTNSNKSFPKTPYKKSNSFTSKDEEPTPKQIFFLKKAGKEIPAGLTKQEAIKLIEDLKK